MCPDQRDGLTDGFDVAATMFQKFFVHCTNNATYQIKQWRLKLFSKIIKLVYIKNNMTNVFIYIQSTCCLICTLHYRQRTATVNCTDCWATHGDYTCILGFIPLLSHT